MKPSKKQSAIRQRQAISREAQEEIRAATPRPRAIGLKVPFCPVRPPVTQATTSPAAQPKKMRPISKGIR
jgi:hypothetical protein